MDKIIPADIRSSFIVVNKDLLADVVSVTNLPVCCPETVT